MSMLFKRKDGVNEVITFELSGFVFHQHLIIFACQTSQSISNTPVTEYGWKISRKKLYTIMHHQKTFSSVKSLCFPVIKIVSKTTHVFLFHWTTEQSWPEKSLILSICLILSPLRNDKKSLLRFRETGVKIKQDVKIYNPYYLTWFLVSHINSQTDVVITFVSRVTSQIWHAVFTLTLLSLSVLSADILYHT